MIKVGVVNIDTSHPLEFAKEMLTQDRARYVAVFNDGFRGENEVKCFAEKFDLDKICDSVEEMADIVDVGFIQGCNWDKHLDYATTFIEKNKPVFIDKPIVGNVADCRKLVELEKNGAVIIGSSSLRYCEEVRKFVTLPDEEKGKVLHIDITVGVDEFNYAVHAVEAMCALAEKSKPISVKYVGAASIEHQECETYFVKFDQGTTGCYHCIGGKSVDFNVLVVTTNNSFCFRINPALLYKALLDQVCNRLEGKPDCLAGMEEITDCIKILLAGKLSKENDGKDIDINSDDLEDICFDGYAFEKEYASKAVRMYV